VFFFHANVPEPWLLRVPSRLSPFAVVALRADDGDDDDDDDNDDNDDDDDDVVQRRGFYFSLQVLKEEGDGAVHDGAQQGREVGIRVGCG